MPNMKSGLAVLVLSVVLAACGSTQGKESTGEYFDDTGITTKVKTAFVADKKVDAMDIKVTTYKGVVTLTGMADSRAEIDRAVELAKNVAGVKSVQNDIRLKTH
ncbi:MAG: BON domain-containing protein [Bacteroidota bacterium]